MIISRFLHFTQLRFKGKLAAVVLLERGKLGL